MASLTPAQIATLRTFVVQSTVPGIVDARTRSDGPQLMQLLNADAVPIVKAWRFVPKEDAMKAIDASEIDNSTLQKQGALDIVLTHANGIDASVPNGPKVITDLWPTAGLASRTAMLATAQENASLAEVVLGGVDVQSANPAPNITAKVRNWVGVVSPTEVQLIMPPSP